MIIAGGFRRARGAWEVFAGRINSQRRVGAGGLRRYLKAMRYVCDAPDRCTWFRFETEAEAEDESRLMQHAVEKYFKRDLERARENYRPANPSSIERDIGLKDHIARTMPLYLTLRADDGEGLATAMLPPQGRNQAQFRIIIVGPENSDPYDRHAAAIAALGAHFGLSLPREDCYPYAGR